MTDDFSDAQFDYYESDEFVIVETVFQDVIKQLDEAGEDITALPIPQQTFLAVYNAQGIIDNGGFFYFFESDFPNNPPYSVFIDAFRRIGAEAAAEALEKAVALFPFENPHLYAEKRDEHMHSYPEEASPLSESHPFVALDCICGDDTNYVLLCDYVLANRKAFKLDELLAQ